MNKLHDKRGRFSRKQKFIFYAISILLIAGVLALAVVGADEVYARASQRVKDFFSPKTHIVMADTPEPTDMKEWVLWKVKQAGIDPYEAYSIINCESRWNPEAHYINYDNKAGVDRGLWMISSYWHKEVSNSDAYNYKKATEEAIRIYKEAGNSWCPWQCGKNLGMCS